jgi:hypothetical protein
VRIEGRWRIVEMELWDQDAIDLLGPAFIEIGSRREGTFPFIAVEGWMDVRPADRDSLPGIAAILTGIRAKLIDALEADA